MTICPTCRSRVTGERPLHDARRAAVSFREWVVYLTPAHNILIGELLKAHPATVSRPVLINAVWGRRDKIEPLSNLKVQMWNLRRELEPLGVRVKACRGNGAAIESGQWWLEWD